MPIFGWTNKKTGTAVESSGPAENPHPGALKVTQLSTPVPSTSIASSDSFNLYTHKDKKSVIRDATWAPRPRNAFIIFRCQFSRLNAAPKGVNAPPRVPGTNDSISRRAAEAWRKMTAPERDVFVQLAAREKEEHTRANPHYRFRPIKRFPRGRKNSYVSAPQPPRSPSPKRVELKESTPESVLESWERVSGSTSALSPPVISSSLAVDPSVKATRRRSNSVPVFGTPFPQFPSTWLSSPSPLSQEFRRSRSVQGDRLSSYWETFPFSAESQLSVPDLLPAQLSSGYSQSQSSSSLFDCFSCDQTDFTIPETFFNDFSPPESNTSGPASPTDDNVSLTFPSPKGTSSPMATPLDAVASSFMNWSEISASYATQSSAAAELFAHGPPSSTHWEERLTMGRSSSSSGYLDAGSHWGTTLNSNDDSSEALQTYTQHLHDIGSLGSGTKNGDPESNFSELFKAL